MGLRQLINTIGNISSHPEGGFEGLLKHFAWQLKRQTRKFPFEINVTPKSKICINSKADLNGCAALCWSMGIYDFNNMSFLRDLCFELGNASALDVGANVGIYALLMSEQASISVEAFEPHPETAKTLARNVALNDRSNIRMHQLALSDHQGKLFFTDKSESTINQVCAQSDNCIEVGVVSADTFCEKLGLSPKIVKIDVEGHELEVLKGMATTLIGLDLLIVEENINFADASGILDHLSGPYFVQYSERRLSRHRGNSVEDPIFVSTNLLNRLDTIWGAGEHPIEIP